MSSPATDKPTSAAGLTVETREMLRTLGNAALQLADEGRVTRSVVHTDAASFWDFGSSSVLRSPLLTIPEACARLRMSRWSLYQLINNRKLATVKIGRRRFVPATEVERFLDELTVVGVRS